MKSYYVCTYPKHVQHEIARELIRAGVHGEDFKRAMNSRLCDLEDTIDVRRWAK